MTDITRVRNVEKMCHYLNIDRFLLKCEVNISYTHESNMWNE